MYADQSLNLPDELTQRIREAAEDVAVSGLYRTAPIRFNRRPTATERNAFTSDVLNEVRWLNSPEGRSRATEKGHNCQSVLVDLIDISLTRAIDHGMSPLQVLYFGLMRTMAQQGFPDDLKLVSEFVATLLAEGERQHRVKMTLVTYKTPEKTRAAGTIKKWLEALEHEYWTGGGYKKPLATVHFMAAEDAKRFKALLSELRVEIVGDPAVPSRGEANGVSLMS
jgi:hypothetical protein